MVVRIGVIDTGLNVSHPNVSFVRPDGTTLRPTNSGYVREPGFRDDDGHGTDVGATVQAFCAQAQLFVVRVTCGNKRNDRFVPVEALAEGIRVCLAEGVQAINISYSSAQKGESLSAACEAAAKRETPIVAAYRNHCDNDVYPAALPKVIGVRRAVAGAPGELSVASMSNRDLFAWGASNSLACAQVTAMVARVYSVDSDLDVVTVFSHLANYASATIESDV